jgi:hypothetical protein
VLPPVPYQDSRTEQSVGEKLLRQCAPALPSTAGLVRRGQDDEHHVVGALGCDGTANRGEPLINAVKTEQAKDAERLGPKGAWPGTGVSSRLCRRRCGHRRTGGAYPIRVLKRNVVSPSLSPRDSAP